MTIKLLNWAQVCWRFEYVWVSNSETQVTADNYVCPDFFLACYFCSRGEPELCDYVLTSAKAQAERDALNKRAMEAEELNGIDTVFA